MAERVQNKQENVLSNLAKLGAGILALLIGIELLDHIDI
jgi:hypothetical protein